MPEDDEDIDYHKKESKGRNRNKNFREIDWITQSEAKRLISTEVEQQHHELFRNIGYDIKEYKELRALREDLLFLRGLRESSQERKSTLLKGFITSGIGAMLGLLTALISWFFASHK